MIDNVSRLEGLIKRSLPTVSVFQNATAESEVEIDVQNEPGKPLSLIRLLLSRASAAALCQDEDLANRLIATLAEALDAPSDEEQAILDLRGTPLD